MDHHQIGDPRAQSISDTAGLHVHTPSFHADEGALKELRETFGYGEGFLTFSLAYCNNDAEEAANMLLENNLPKELAHLNRGLPLHTDTGGGHAHPLTGDPRAAWLRPEVQPVPKEEHKDASADHRAAGIGHFGDPRAAWVHAGDDITPKPQPVKYETHEAPKDIEDPRARRG
ncbi:g6140 [Coccomyxa viridis]|uniref:G6140 protein n=1 Tax=Coccomyxa viridis TaxID=1274662 RepID=A0ABP1FVZ6_9CHLO